MTKPPILAQDNSRLSGRHSYLKSPFQSGQYPFAINLSVAQCYLTTDFEPV